MAETAAKIGWRLQGLRDQGLLGLLAITLSVMVILSSALHFWPFQNNRLWELLTPANSLVTIWVCILVLHSLVFRDASAITRHLPRMSILAFLCVVALSLVVTPDVSRTFTYLAKLLLVYLGAYTLFVYAGKNRQGYCILCVAICTALGISLVYCLVDRIINEAGSYGFFDNTYKYGTYVGVLCPLCVGILLVERRSWWATVLGLAFVMGTAASVGTVGGMISLVAGLFVCLAFGLGARVKVSIALAFACIIVAVISMSDYGPTAGLCEDASFTESQGQNVRQRYIEWQALINLLEDRSGTGVGAGSVNVFRSMYYYRLPKLNTMSSFEQNGWLAAGAETGLIGLLCFCWLVVDYMRIGLRRIKFTTVLVDKRTVKGVASMAGLCAACAANIFSSVHYNGVLIIFVLVLAFVGMPKETWHGYEHTQLAAL